MTLKEENIVNIAMRAAELLKDGKIERDDINGHAGLTEAIINLAQRFELEHKGVDYDAGDHDYWIEVDDFAEQNLLEQFGLEQAPSEKTPVTIYLCSQKEHTYNAVAALDVPPFEGAIKLATEKSYPVELLFTRTDMNGSTCFETDKCENLNDLLSALDWCGKCRYTIHEIWDFDLDKTQDQALVDLFGDAYLHRMKLIEKETEVMYRDDPAPFQPLTEQIHGAQQRVGQTPDPVDQTHAEPTH